MNRARARGVARGVVQGVGFRWFLRTQARTLGLAGWVRNCPDGSVEFVAEGAASAVDALVSAARMGPPEAIVEELTIGPFPSEVDVPFPFDVHR